MTFRIVFFPLLFIFVFIKCTPSSSQFDPFVYGKIRKNITVENDQREYVMHVPKGYIGSKALPVVIVLHGRGSNGNEFYNQSGWGPLSDQENIFTVFPSAQAHCTTDAGIQFSNPVWNSLPAGTFTACPGIVMKSDITFLKEMILKMNIEYNIDKKRIYVVGFANGAQMAAKVSIDMDNQIAAIVQFAGSFTNETTWSPNKNVPVLFQVENQDNIFFNASNSIPLSQFEVGLLDTNNPLHPVASSYVKSFGLKSQYVMSGDTISQITATYSDMSDNPMLTMSLLKGTRHSYPGLNDNLSRAKQHWEWLKKYSLL